MFIDIRNLQERRAERDSQFEGTRDIRNGYLFEVNGSVAGDREGLVWFKALDGNSEPFQVFYNGIIGDLRANMFVKIERNPKSPARWQVIEFDTGIYFDDQSSYEQLPSTSMIPAKEDYEWPPGHPGAKALNIFPRAITDFAVRPTSPASMKARVYSGIYPGATNYARFQGPVNTKDFTADIPGAGLARLAAISIDNTGTLNYTNGTTFVDGLPMPDASLPAVPASQMLISAIRLVNGMTAIEEGNFDLEMRPLLANGTVNVKVSEVWESDFGAVALESDATANITINTGTLTLPSDIIHLGDTDTKISFTPDDIEFTAGALSMLKLTKTTQDLITLGPGSGDVDINFNGDMFLQGSDGFLGVGINPPDKLIHMHNSSGFADFKCSSGSDNFGGRFEFATATGSNPLVGLFGTGYTAVSEYANKLVFQTFGRDIALAAYGSGDEIHFYTGGRTSAFRRITIDGNGKVGIGTTSPSYKLHVVPSVGSLPSLPPGDGILLQNNVATTTNARLTIIAGTAANSILDFGDSGSAISGQFVYNHTNDEMRFTTAGIGNRLLINSSGNIGLGVASPSAKLDIGAGDIELSEMTAPGAGAANTARLYAVDNGAGKTQLVVIFSSGAAQVLATQP